MGDQTQQLGHWIKVGYVLSRIFVISSSTPEGRKHNSYILGWIVIYFQSWVTFSFSYVSMAFHTYMALAMTIYISIFGRYKYTFYGLNICLKPNIVCSGSLYINSNSQNCIGLDYRLVLVCTGWIQTSYILSLDIQSTSAMHYINSLEDGMYTKAQDRSKNASILMA